MGNRDHDDEDCEEDDSDDVRQPCSRACSRACGRQPTDRHRPHPILPITAPQRRHSATFESSNTKNQNTFKSSYTKYKTLGRAETQTQNTLQSSNTNAKHLGELIHKIQNILQSSNTNAKHLGELKHRPAAPAVFVCGVQIMSCWAPQSLQNKSIPGSGYKLFTLLCKRRLFFWRAQVSCPTRL